MKSLVLTSDRFGFEPEVTARLAQARARIWEVAISYSGRTYAEGKKIGWRDGVAAIMHIVRFNLFPPEGDAAPSGQHGVGPGRRGGPGIVIARTGSAVFKSIFGRWPCCAPPWGSACWAISWGGSPYSSVLHRRRRASPGRLFRLSGRQPILSLNLMNGES